ncbi:MAG: D-glycero-beta-D-manno-heptose 1,7-bisphosphate 7-phosphatase [Promethearchaeota archaeon]
MSDNIRAIFLDRDGVINEEIGYLSKPEGFKFIDGSIQALKILKNKGFLLIIITNQAGIARGYYTEKILGEIHDKMNNMLRKSNVLLDDIIYCPHHPKFTGPCECRKPKPGMIFEARDKFNINLNDSFMVGDTLNDIETGLNAGCKTVLLMTGYGTEEEKKIDVIKPDLIFKNLLDFAQNV